MILQALLALALPQAQAASSQSPASKTIASSEPSYSKLISDCKTGSQSLCEGTWHGLHYSIDRDGTYNRLKVTGGTEWGLNCHSDRMTDAKTCSLTSDVREGQPYLLVMWGSKWAGASVSVANMGEAYPHSVDSLRVDHGPLHTVREDDVWSGASSLAIMRELRSGHTLLMRYKDWPYNADIDGEVSLEGFQYVLEAMAAVRTLSKVN